MIEGSCHCGSVRWRFDGRPEWATACNCTVCRRYGTLWSYDFEDEKISVSGETRGYERGERSMSFHFCPNCGCVAYWRALAADQEGRRRIAVNLRLADVVVINKMDRPGADFDRCVGELDKMLDAHPIPIQLPILEKDTFHGVIDLVDMKAVYYDEADPIARQIV